MSTTVTMNSISSHHVPPPLIIPLPPTPPDGPRRTRSSISIGTLAHSATTVQSSPPETPSTTGDRQFHHPPGQTSGDVNKKGSKGKSTSLLGFLTVKEPSRLALEQYERDMKRKATQAAKKAGRPLNANALAAPTAKLPASVPKVNSKWDGLPKAVSEQKKGKAGQGNEAHRRSDISERRDQLRRLGNETQASFGTFGARHSGIGGQHRSRSQNSRDGSEYAWVRGYTHSGRSRSSTMNSPPQTSSSLGSWSVSSQSEAPSVMSDFTWDGLQPGRSGLSVREAVLKAPPVTPNSQPPTSSSMVAPSSNSSQSKLALRAVGEGVLGPPISTRLKTAAPLLRSEDLIEHDDEVEPEMEGKKSVVEKPHQQPSNFDHDLLVPQDALMTTALAASRELEKSHPPASESRPADAPQISSNRNRTRRVTGRTSLVTPWETLEPPKSTTSADTRPPSPPCPVKNLLRRARRKVFPTK